MYFKGERPSAKKLCKNIFETENARDINFFVRPTDNDSKYWSWLYYTFT